MQRLNRDSIIAILLLLACGGLYWASFDIRVPDYGQLKPSTWPRLILAGLSILGVIYLIQSLRQGPDEPNGEGAPEGSGLIGWVLYWRNPIWCFGLFFAYLVTLPWLGSLIGGVAFVFTLMGVLGGWSLSNMIQHLILALLTVGGMWSLFTFGLGVILPTGVIFSPF